MKAIIPISITLVMPLPNTAPMEADQIREIIKVNILFLLISRLRNISPNIYVPVSILKKI